MLRTRLPWLALLCASAAFAAEPLRLDLAKAEALAARHSHLLAQRQEEVLAARARAQAASARLLPRVTGTLRYARLSYVAPAQLELPFTLPNGTRPDPVQLGEAIENQLGSSVVLEQPLFTGFALLHGREAADQGVAAAEARLEQERQDVLLHSQEAYFALFEARELLQVAERALEGVSAHLGRLTRAAAVGAGTPLEANRTSTRVGAARVQLLQAQAAEATAALALATLLGVDAQTPFELTEDVDRLPPAPAGDLVERAQHRPELRSARAAAEARQSQARAAEGPLWPQAFLRASAQYDSPNTRYFPLENELRGSWDAAVVVSWAAWDFGANRALLRAAEHDALAAEHAVAQLEDLVQTEVGRERTLVALADERVRAAQEAVDVAQQGLKRAQTLCEAGQAACLVVLDAEADLARLRAEWVQARTQRHLAAARLARAAGALTPTAEHAP
jgi:cobalt-zinc-cadmium efflux system outer membrane protein